MVWGSGGQAVCGDQLGHRVGVVGGTKVRQLRGRVLGLSGSSGVGPDQGLLYAGGQG